MKNLEPEISRWYSDAVNNTLFEVVAIDDESGTIEFQLVDGEVGEYDISTWKSLMLKPAEAPEDWRGPIEMPNEDDYFCDEAIVPENFSGVLSEFEPDLIDFGDDFSI